MESSWSKIELKQNFGGSKIQVTFPQERVQDTMIQINKINH